MITVEDFMDLSVDASWQTIHIYDNDKGEEVFVGTINDMPDKYRYGDIGSFDIIDTDCPRLTLNVDPNYDYDNED
jgi:hypothetical protein